MSKSEPTERIDSKNCGNQKSDRIIAHYGNQFLNHSRKEKKIADKKPYFEQRNSKASFCFLHFNFISVLDEEAPK